MNRLLCHLVLVGLAMALLVALVQAYDDEPVRLRLKECRQSSDYSSSRCSGAIDGVTSGLFSLSTMSWTNSEAEPFWETQTQQLTEFVNVRIFNRQDCCQDRLNNFVIKVDGHVCAEYSSVTSFAIKTFSCNREGRVLRIESRIPSHLTLAEVQVFGFNKGPRIPPSLLRLSNCHQSSSYAGSKCTGAIDGSTNQAYSLTQSSYTNPDAFPWWEASTAAPSKIMQVRIFNRQDSQTDNLRNFVIKVDDVVCAHYNSRAPFSVWTFDCNRVGRTVRIESRVSVYLGLAEVQVFGEPASSLLAIENNNNQEQPSNPEPAQLHLRNCRQSSEYAGVSRCFGAIDGITTGAFSYHGMSSTSFEASPWWEAQTEQLTEFARVRIINRQDCCQDRLNNFVIKVDDNVCAEYSNATSFSSWTFDCRARGRVLRIENRKFTQLALMEVQAFGVTLEPKSPAPQLLPLSNCRQSSTAPGQSKCSKAIDGNTMQRLPTSHMIMSSTNFENHPWWEASTEQPSNFRFIRIFNRQDSNTISLTNFEIKVDGVECNVYSSSAPFSVWDFDCNRVGRTVRIESRKSISLSLVEVQAFGEPIAKKECFTRSEVFVGTSEVTETGNPCQSWSVKTCADHEKGVSCHVPSELLLDSGLTGNTCRNPPSYMRDRPWCYTTTATRWEFCSVPEC